MNNEHTCFDDLDDVFYIPPACHVCSLLAAQTNNVDWGCNCLFSYLITNSVKATYMEEDMKGCSNP